MIVKEFRVIILLTYMILSSADSGHDLFKFAPRRRGRAAPAILT